MGRIGHHFLELYIMVALKKYGKNRTQKWTTPYSVMFAVYGITYAYK